MPYLIESHGLLITSETHQRKRFIILQSSILYSSLLDPTRIVDHLLTRAAWNRIDHLPEYKPLDSLILLPLYYDIKTSSGGSLEKYMQQTLELGTRYQWGSWNAVRFLDESPKSSYIKTFLLLDPAGAALFLTAMPGNNTDEAILEEFVVTFEVALSAVATLFVLWGGLLGRYRYCFWGW